MNFEYKTFGGWVRSYGLKISDIPENLLEQAKKEYEARKSGATFLDGVLDEIATGYRIKD